MKTFFFIVFGVVIQLVAIYIMLRVDDIEKEADKNIVQVFGLLLYAIPFIIMPFVRS